MSIPPAVLDAMVAAGASAEVIAAAVKASQQDAMRKADEKRAKDRERKRKSREAEKMSRNVTRTDADNGVTPRDTPLPLSPSNGSPTPPPITTPYPIPPGGGGGKSAREPLISPEAVAVAEEVMAIAGVDREFVPPGWCGAPARVQVMFAQGWSRETILAGARRGMANKRDGPPDSIAYLEKPIAREHAAIGKPLPIVTRTEPTHERPSQNAATAIARNRRKQLADHIAERSADGLGVSDGGANILRLPQGGR